MAQSRSAYEFKFTDLHGNDKSLPEQMNAIGAEGWKAISFELHSGANWWVLWQREVVKDEFDGSHPTGGDSRMTATK